MAVVTCSPLIARADGEAVLPSAHVDDLLAGATSRASGLTADRVAERAVATSLDVASRRADTAAERAHVEAAAIGFVPRLALLASYTRNSPITVPSFGNAVVAPPGYAVGPVAPGTPLSNVPFEVPAYLNQYLSEATLTVPISDYLFRLSQRYESAARSESAADLSRRAEELLVGANARVAYYEWARVKLARVVAEQGLALARLHLHDARALLASGMTSDADVLGVESQVAVSEQLVGRAANGERAAAEQLRTFMHSLPGEPFEIGEDFSSSLADDEVTDLDVLVRRAAHDRLELRALGETAASLDAQAAATRAAALPRLDGIGSVVYADPNPRYIPNQSRFDATWALGVQLTWTPNDTASSLVEAKETDARARSARARRGALLDGVRTEVSEGVRAWSDARLAIETSARSLAASEESYRVRRALFLNQRATSVELSTAEADLLRAQLDAINARIDQRIARVRIAHAIGRDVRS
jgi:outer membrane protein TolC